MVGLVRRYVLVEDIVRIIFEELASEWLQSMWDSNDDRHSKMIKILYLIYLIKTQP
jgi:hypothetical protein